MIYEATIIDRDTGVVRKATVDVGGILDLSASEEVVGELKRIATTNFCDAARLAVRIFDQRLRVLSD